MGKVFSYIRFSSAKQSAGDSYARQVKAAKAFCDEHSLELADPRDYLFFDAGRSAYKGRHLDDTGELARFLTYVEDGTIPAGSYLVVESLDRLSRERVRDAPKESKTMSFAASCTKSTVANGTLLKGAITALLTQM